ncbi:2,4,5-trihydroxytoluene oxygenase [Streptomyces sp. AJS327]|uniref:VOC family protein n=1 Tax=Streptomyces sp. AJS327 TaxID=2545265 RepID=UPI0015DF19FC|nr:VOC family protein [Streptomyces sp. AJS327]MBA0050660.1 2,4,5-trihydroxytoluene oxygenase [Streptomyces sp. AJS327]
MATAIDAAHVTYEAPDLEVAEKFLTAFGMTRVAGSDDHTLYMRGTGTQHHIHVTRKADRQRFVGASIEVATHDDLVELAALPGSSPVRRSTEPGGGDEVVMTMPDGIEIRAIHGRAKAEPITGRAPFVPNNIRDKNRVNATVRVATAPATIARLGHFVLHVRNHDESMAWLTDRFNFLPSDYFLPPGQDGPVVGTFVRLDLGEQLVDHHFLLVLESDWVGVHHSAFEVTDMDAVMSSHDYLLREGYTPDVGVGRHLLGSQVFDYWKDPFGFRIEHYTDGDVVDANHRPGRFNGTASETTQWGSRPPLEFFA